MEKDSNVKKASLTSRQKYALIGGALIIVLVMAFFLLFGQNSPDEVQAFSDYLYYSNSSGIVMDIRGSPDNATSAQIMQCGVNLISGGFFAKTQKNLLIYACDEKGCLSAAEIEAAKNNSAIKNNSTNTSLSASAENDSNQTSPQSMPLLNGSRPGFNASNSSEDLPNFAAIASEQNSSVKNVSVESNNTSIAPPKYIGYDEVLYNMRGRAYFHVLYGPEQKKQFHATYVEVYMNSTSDPSQCSVNVQTQ